MSRTNESSAMRKRNRRTRNRRDAKILRTQERAKQTVQQIMQAPMMAFGAHSGIPSYRPKRHKLKGYQKETVGRKKNFSKF